ncbi:MAG: tyrosine-type recombinase/integrase [Thiohalocapsa sp.]
MAAMSHVRVARTLPVALSPEEVERLLDAAPAVAYGSGLRVSEVVALKVDDIDSQRMVIRVDQGKGRKDRYVMLSTALLGMLRAWWREAKARGQMLPHSSPQFTLCGQPHACPNAAIPSQRGWTDPIRTASSCGATNTLDSNPHSASLPLASCQTARGFLPRGRFLP